MIKNFINDIFRINENEFKIIPIHWNTSHYYSMSFSGWNNISIDSNDVNFNFIVKLASLNVKYFLEFYKDLYAFTQPRFSITQDATILVKIGVIEISDYEKRMDSKAHERKDR